jgi:hypothetical protein
MLAVSHRYSLHGALQSMPAILPVGLNSPRHWFANTHCSQSPWSKAILTNHVQISTLPSHPSLLPQRSLQHPFWILKPTLIQFRTPNWSNAPIFCMPIANLFLDRFCPMSPVASLSHLALAMLSCSLFSNASTH